MAKSQAENLIERLVADAAPVKRLLPPGLRAALWIAGFVACVAIAVWLQGTFSQSVERFSDLTVRLEFTGALLTGITALVSAFLLSLPDRSKTWLVAPVLPFAFWLSGSGYGCYLNLVEFGPTGWAIGDSWVCIRFILAVSIPASVVLYFSLRRSMPLEPVPPLVVGGLGVAGLASAALQFFHPFDITFLDLGVHILAVAMVIAAFTLIGRRGLTAYGFPTNYRKSK